MAINFAKANNGESINAENLAYRGYDPEPKNSKTLKTALPANCPCLPINEGDNK